MQKENPLTQRKNELRSHFLTLLKNIPKDRREEARNKVKELSSHQGNILSFCSLGSEIDTSLLNEPLLEGNRLFYPRVEGSDLFIYKFEQSQSLVVSSLYIQEPNPTTARKTPFSEIDLILVPALAFDQEGYRLGRGKGFYDRLLSTTKNIPTMGIGFQEQLSPHLLPRDSWDVPVQEVFLF